MASYTDDALDKLLNQFNSYSGYTPLTDQQISEQAQRKAQSQYDAQRLAARQQADSYDLALSQQLAGLQDTYDRQRKQSAENFAQAVSQHERGLVRKGMQRSSYGANVRANIDLKGNEAQAEIGRAQAAQEGNLGALRTQNQQQLAQKLAQYDIGQQSDALAYADQLREREYERQQADRNSYNSLALNIAQLQQQKANAAADQARWEAEFAFSQQQANKKSSGGGSSGSKKTAAASAPSLTNPAAAIAAGIGGAAAAAGGAGTTSAYSSWLNALKKK